MKKRTRRTHYALANPIALAIAGATITDDGRLDKLRTLELSAIEAWRSGAASVADWRTLADLVNLTQMLCEMGVGAEAMTTTLQVEEHLRVAHAQHQRCGRMETGPEAMKAFRDLYEYHDLQRTSVDRSTYERAIKRTRDRIRSAHASVKVCVA